jgi:hypothetical protein
VAGRRHERTDQGGDLRSGRVARDRDPARVDLQALGVGLQVSEGVQDLSRRSRCWRASEERGATTT